MHPDLEKLIPLQASDKEARRLREELDAVPRRLAQSEIRTRQAAERQKALESNLAAEETVRRRLESDIADLRAKNERTGKKIDAATTTVQVTALEHEADFARREIARLEDVELESMERSETLAAQQTAAADEVAELELGLMRERERSETTVRTDRAALAEVDATRQRMRQDVAQSDTGEASLARYDRVVKARGTAIAEAVLGKCAGCAMMLRPQLWQDLRDNSADSPSRESLLTCETCGRLLYYDPARDAPQRKPVQGETIAASIVRSSL